MRVADLPATPHLDARERDCLARYVGLLTGTLADLEEVWLFGSSARGDRWPAWWPSVSDIDLLVVTAAPVPEDPRERLLEPVYELYLECGRTIGPQFRTAGELASGDAVFRENAARDGVLFLRRA